MVKCNTCGGIYDPVMADGMQYFHACPPLALHEVKRGVAEGTVQLTRLELLRLREAQDADVADPPAEGEVSREDEVLRSFVVERQNRRDENVTGEIDPESKRSRIRAEGAGTSPVTSR